MELYLTMKTDEINRLNNLLYPLFPALRDRLENQCGKALDEWLDKMETKSVEFIRSDENAEPFIGAIDWIEESAANAFDLDMEGWDGIGFTEMFSPQDKEELQSLLCQFVASRSPAFALKQLIEAIKESGFPDENRDNIVFFVYGALQETDAPEELSELWILRSNQSSTFDSSFRYGYMFLMEDGCGFNRCWELCRDVLPPEILPAFDAEWVGEDKE